MPYRTRSPIKRSNSPPDELSRILSPKTPKKGVKTSGQLLRLNDYNLMVEEPFFNLALNQVATKLEPFSPPRRGKHETNYYRGLAAFLTGCVEACHSALDGQKGGKFPARDQRWYSTLEFIVAKSAAAGVEGAAPLKPDIVGGNGILKFQEERLHWDPPATKPGHRIMLPVEVKSRWKDMVCQAATYARCLFTAPTRVFALVLVFNQVTNNLRFLVFHRGGLAASKLCNITKKGGLRDAARLFLTLALWRTSAEAGILAYSNQTTYLLPADGTGERYISATVEEILFRSLCIRGRMTNVFLLRLPTGPPPAGSQPPKEPLEPSIELAVDLRRSKRIAKKPKGPASGGESGGTRSQAAKEDIPLSDVPEELDGGCSLVGDLVAS